jgi:hypothetical protein
MIFESPWGHKRVIILVALFFVINWRPYGQYLRQ